VGSEPASTKNSKASAEYKVVPTFADKSLEYQTFLQRYPDYIKTDKLDHLRAEDYPRLDKLNQVYLDYTGGSLYADS
jgi:hypothetical protein